MLMITALTLKKTITLFALVEPVTMVPLFLATTRELELQQKARFARTIGLSVTIAVIAAKKFANQRWISSSAWVDSSSPRWRWR